MTDRRARPRALGALCGAALMVAVAAWAATSWAGCARDEVERAAHERTIGKARVEGGALEIAGGLAHVREAVVGRWVLWAQAPALELTLEADADAPRVWEVVCHNALADAEWRWSGAPEGADAVARDPLSDDPPTVRRWRITIPPGAQRVQAQIAPPDWADAETPWRFGVLSDVQEAIGTVQDVFDRINDDPEIRFVVSAGDLTVLGRHAQLARFQQALKGLHVPFYTTLGNHELGSDWRNWYRLFGRASFSFVFRDVRFTFVDSGDATIAPTVYAWLDDWLAQGRHQRHVFLTHVPPLDPVGTRNGAFASRHEAGKLLGRLAEADVDVTLYGHIHSFYAFSNGGIPAYISGGGGALPETLDGIDRHFLAIDLDVDGVREVSVVRVDD